MIPNLDRGLGSVNPEDNKCTKLTIDGKPIAAIMRGKKLLQR